MGRITVRYDLRDIAHNAMLYHGLAPDFPQAALDDARAMTAARPEAAASIRDLRDLLWCSIDNDDSRDLDQLSVAEAIGKGATRIMVAVADVDALVKAGSAIDKHAMQNTTSVYTAAGVFPMLPERLSTDLTSLNEGEERMAVVVDMRISAGGEVESGDVYHAFVRNRAKLAYNAVAAWLEGTGLPPPKLAAIAGLDVVLRLQDRTAQAMRQRRREQGALRLETNEAQPVFEDGVLVDMRPAVINRARELIEEFMVAANGVTARYLAGRGLASIRRSLRTPKRWTRLVALAAEFGEKLPLEPSPIALDAFLDKRSGADPEGFADLSLTVVKLLGSGEYEMVAPGKESEGHFGLAVRDYNHSTAPNRRFPDLIVQRLLKAAIAGAKPPYSADELAALAGHCTLQEDNAAKVERQVRKSAAALLLMTRIGMRADAIVTGASEKGTWVRIAKPLVEGKLVRGAEGLDVGDRLRVELIHVDVVRGFIDFARVAGRNGRDG
jgi:exoribonuclease-2